MVHWRAIDKAVGAKGVKGDIEGGFAIVAKARLAIGLINKAQGGFAGFNGFKASFHRADDFVGGACVERGFAAAGCAVAAYAILAEDAVADDGSIANSSEDFAGEAAGAGAAKRSP